MNEAVRKLLSQIKVASNEDYIRDLKAGAPLICMRVEDMPSTSFPDNKVAHCALCDMPIWYRPYNEEATNKICNHCWSSQVKAAEA